MRRALIACSTALALAAGAAWAMAQQTGPAAKPPAAAAPVAGAPAHGVTHGVVKAPAKMAEKPLWKDLNPAQRTALAPLATEWDQMNGVRKQKWLEMSNHFASLKPDEQARIQERMREWVRLTPAERKLARDTYKRTKKLAPGEKTATWESYQQLPDDQKHKLAEAAAARKQGMAAATGTHASPLHSGASSCPAGKIKNKVSATPPCVPAPAPAPAPAAAQTPAASAAAAQPSPTTPPLPASAPAVPASNGQ
ncbi:hypothetical protein GCM10027321_31410 [Massilia terrae]|uniref:DUF3106 domain-containing protein n=1 Tax=Massilia terrae TaxID=1811224 RepID=A0ABT2CRE0_9BURK|nr:DUF3106 domain-containing protein [Massilia terrae]MCS0656522.1 DUF3106 domain-containing protein [Massilia terrae]